MAGRAYAWIVAIFGSVAAADDLTATHARRVTELADRWVTQIETRYPITYLASGLPTARHDTFDQNSPEDMRSWRAFLASIEAELNGIPESALSGKPEWVTWHYLRQGLAQEHANELCRSELWQVAPLGWQSHLSQIADLQPVGTEEQRAQAFTRWRQMPAWIDREIANLKEGLRLGHTASQSSAAATLKQFDALIGVRPGDSPLMSAASRAGTSEFRKQWEELLQTELWPALTRYRDFLSNEYLPRARKTVSLAGNRNGLACYRALILSGSTVDVEPRKLFELAMERHRAEHALAMDFGRKLYGERAKDWQALSKLMREDPRAKFSSRAEVDAYIQRSVARAVAAEPKIVLEALAAPLKAEPFAEFAQQTGPAGEYVRGADDGSRPGVFYYRNRPESVSRASLQSLIFHETVPGHHLQAAVLARQQRKALHPVTRLIWFSGPSEGWASYAENLARENGLYDSDFEVAGALLSSVTPPMVADLGMQVMGWSREQAVAFVNESMPLRPLERSEALVATIAGSPGGAISYPLGAMQFEQLRQSAWQKLGNRFDVREFHEVVLADGMLPFPALRAKVDRWVELHRRAAGHRGAVLPAPQR
jgi:uncharacterized protein (DUF885 family)